MSPTATILKLMDKLRDLINGWKDILEIMLQGSKILGLDGFIWVSSTTTLPITCLLECPPSNPCMDMKLPPKLIIFSDIVENQRKKD